MTRLKLITMAVFCAAAAVFGTSPLLAATDFLATVPADSLFCVRLNNLDAAAGATDQFVSGIAPMPPLSMMIRMKLAELVGDANMPGISTSGTFGLFGIAKDSDTDPQVFLVMPVTDMKALLSSPSVGKADANGVSMITSPMMGGGEDVAMLPAGSFAILCPPEEYDGLVALAKPSNTLEQTLTPAEKKASATAASLWARVDMARVNTLYKDEISEAFEEMEKMPNPMAPGPADNSIMKAYFSSLLALLKQSQAVDITLTPKADAVTLSSMLVAVPGSEMAKTLALGPTPKGSPQLQGYLKDGAMANFYMRLNKPVLKKVYISMLDIFAGTGEVSKEDLDKTKALVEKAMDACGDSLVGTLRVVPGAKPVFAAEYFTQIKDPKAMKDCIKEATDMMQMGLLANMYKASGMDIVYSYTPDAANYNGISIDGWKMSMHIADANSPQGQMIATMYGDGFAGRTAFVDSMLLSCGGADADATIRKMIDAYKGGTPSGSAEFRSAAAMVPDAANADFICTYNYLRLFKGFTGILPIPGVAEAFANLPESKSNLAVAGRVADGMLSVDLVVPKQHAMEIVDAFKQMQSSMQKGPGPMPGPGGMPMKGKGGMPE